MATFFGGIIIVENIGNFLKHLFYYDTWDEICISQSTIVFKGRVWHNLGVKIFLLACLMTGCAGYHVTTLSNPLKKKFGIGSISIPTFINQSGIPHVSVPLTKSIVLLLAKYPSLKIYSGEKSEADAILIGVVRSQDRRGDIIQTSRRSYVDGELSSSVGERNTFSVPSESVYRLTLQLALIKNPTSAEVDLLKSGIGPHITQGAKIIFNETILLKGRFQREVGNTVTSRDSGVVNFTKTKHHFEESLVGLGNQAAAAFKDTVLNAF